MSEAAGYSDMYNLLYEYFLQEDKFINKDKSIGTDCFSAYTTKKGNFKDHIVNMMADRMISMILSKTLPPYLANVKLVLLSKTGSSIIRKIREIRPIGVQ